MGPADPKELGVRKVVTVFEGKNTGFLYSSFLLGCQLLNNIESCGDPVRPLRFHLGSAWGRPLPWERFPSLSPNKKELFLPALVRGGKTLDYSLTRPGLYVHPTVLVVDSFE